MNMIWHNHEGMQKIVPKYAGVVPYGFHDYVCNRRLAQIECPGAGFVQQSIHAANACPEFSDSFGKARFGGRLS